MKTNLIFLLLLISYCFSTIYAQTISCPPDMTVHETEIVDGEFYGDPVVDGFSNYKLTKEIQMENLSCDSIYLLKKDIVYTVKVNNTPKVSCTQHIDITKVQDDELTFPDAAVIIPNAVYSDASIDVSGRITPRLSNYSTIQISYKDIAFPSGPDFKIIRTWTVFNFCNGNMRSYNQIIRLKDVKKIANVKVLNPKGYEYQIEHLEFDVPSDSPCYDLKDSYVELVQCLIDHDKEIKIKNVEVKPPTGNPISTLDIVLIVRHILGLEKFTDIGQYYAADINSDSKVSLTDLVSLKKMVVGQLPFDYQYEYYQKSKLRYYPTNIPYENIRTSIPYFVHQDIENDSYIIYAVLKGDLSALR